MKRLDIDDLHLMMVIKDSASLSAAASKLGITTSSVSRRVKKIEKIIERSLLLATRNLHLSEVGEEFLRLSHEVLDMCDNFQKRIKNASKTLRVIGNPALLRSDLPEVLDMFTIKHPGTKIQIFNGLANETHEAVRSGQVDVGIVPDNPCVDGLIFHKYRTERLVAMVSYLHPLTKRSVLTLSEIARYPLVGTNGDNVITTILRAAAKKELLMLNYLMEIDDYSLQAEIAARTDPGVAIVFESTAKRLSVDQRFNIIPLDEPWAEFNIFMCLPNVLRRSKPTDTFINLMFDKFKK